MSHAKKKKKTKPKEDKPAELIVTPVEEKQSEGSLVRRCVFVREDERRADGTLQEESDRDGLDQCTSFFIPVVQRYEGDMLEVHFHGEGFANMRGGHTYEGMFSKGLMEGYGVFTRADGLKYMGEFKNNTPEGQGTYTWPDGSSYVGEVRHGLRHGTGTYTCASKGVTYMGQWDEGKRHGKGLLHYNRERTSWYDGEWVHNKREGWGVRCYPSGNIYSGQWKNNLRHGDGTMRWLNVGQQYVGKWKKGIQEGQGTHIWILRQVEESQCFLSNQYTGSFVQGLRDGQGTFYHASGAIFKGEWRNNKSFSKGRFTSICGQIFEGVTFEQMMTQDLYGNKTLIPLFDMVLNIEELLAVIPEREQEAERKQVEFVLWTHYRELRSIYRFYSRLGFGDSPHNLSLMTRLQLWCLIKDCCIHHQGIPLSKIDCLMADSANPADIHSPFSPILLRRFLYCLVVLAYNIYYKDLKSQSNVLASCFSKLMTDNILPHAKNVKGLLFRHPDYATGVLAYIERCWAIFQSHCKAILPPTNDESMTCRDMLWLFKDLKLLDETLTTARVMEMVTAGRPDGHNFSSFLYVKLSFLDFFEILLGCAEVRRLSCEELKELQTPSVPKSSEDVSLTDGRFPLPQDPMSLHMKLQQAEQTDGLEVEVLIQKTHLFFNYIFFPAVERKLKRLHTKKR